MFYVFSQVYLNFVFLYSVGKDICHPKLYCKLRAKALFLGEEGGTSLPRTSSHLFGYQETGKFVNIQGV